MPITSDLIRDKAPGIYQTPGPNDLLLRLVTDCGKLSGEAAETAVLYAGFLRSGYGPTLEQLYSFTSRLAIQLGEVLALTDIILGAADYSLNGSRGKELQQTYDSAFRRLLQIAEQRGLASDYSAAPERQARFQAAGLHRPGFLETESIERSFPNEKSDL